MSNEPEENTGSQELGGWDNRHSRAFFFARFSNPGAMKGEEIPTKEDIDVMRMFNGRYKETVQESREETTSIERAAANLRKATTD